MDEPTKQEITRLLLEQVAIDEAVTHQCAIAGKMEDITSLTKAVLQSDYRSLPAAWAIPLYLGRN